MINCTGGELTLGYLYSNEALHLMSYPLVIFITIASLVLFALMFGGLLYLAYLWNERTHKLDDIEERINSIEYNLKKRRRR